MPGHIDGLVRGALTGWLADADAPGVMQDVACVGASGRTVRFRTTLLRPDVTKVRGFPGRIGFAIPLAALDGIGPIVSLHGPDGGVLGPPVALPQQRAAGARSGPPHSFLRLPHVAGASLRAGFAIALPPGAAAWIEEPGGLTRAEFAALPAEQREAMRLLFGAFAGADDPLLPAAARCLAFMREPMARVRSAYWQARRRGPTLIVEGEGEMPLSQVVNEGLAEAFDNAQLRAFTGQDAERVPFGCLSTDIVQQAVMVIATRFDFVGFLESAAEDWPAMLRCLGLQDTELPTRRCSDPLNPDDADDRRVNWEMVERNNRFDAMLYGSVRQLRQTPGLFAAAVG
ncbi:MAG TPA: hypothetical protein VHY76_08050 [Acetobacteraceae bacterium]|nr:hypothetical protein [Acetobacteraceae bacterium]